MRTTVELPPALLRAAKARSAEQGESLKALLTRAVTVELDSAPSASRHRARVRLPLFGSPAGPPVLLTNDDLARVLAAADAASVASPARRRSRRRHSR